MEPKIEIPRGTVALIDGVECVLIRELHDGTFQFEALKGKKFYEYSGKEILSLQAKKKISLDTSPLLLRADPPDEPKTESEIKEGKRRMVYVKAFLKSGISPKDEEDGKALIDKIAQKIKDDKPPSGSTIYRWIKLSEGGRRNPHPHYSNRGRRGATKFHRYPRLLELTENCAERFYLDKKRWTITTLWGSLTKAIKEEQNATGKRLPFPSYEDLRKYINSLDLYEVTAARYDEAKAKHDFEAVMPLRKASRNLEVLELDCTRLDIIVRICGVEMGRPWLTVMIDQHSRMIVGFHLTVVPPSVATVAQTFMNGFFSKDYLSHERFCSILNSWPCFGRPELVIVDRGKENIADDTIEMGDDIGILIQPLPGRSPWLKGVVERFFRTLNQGFTHQISGTTRSNPDDRGPYNSEKESFIELDDLYVYMHRWIIDVYHQKYHLGLRARPIDVWNKSAEKHPVSIILPTEKLERWTMLSDDRKLSNRGIRIDYLDYNSQEIVDWLKDRRVNKPRAPTKNTAKVRIKFPPDNLDYIEVQHPVDKYWVRVDLPESQSETVAGLNRWQHQALVRLSKSSIKAQDSEAKMTQAVILEELALQKEAFVKQMRQAKKIASREARLLGMGQLSSSGGVMNLPSDGNLAVSDQDEESKSQDMSLNLDEGFNLDDLDLDKLIFDEE